MAPATDPDGGRQADIKPVQVLSLGCLRTGSASIAQALTILGYRNVHHGIQAISNPKDWEALARASDAHFPALPGYTGTPFTRADWDEVFGDCEAVTDMGSFWAVPLTAAYPEAKVIVAERADVEAWYASMEAAVFSTTWGWRADLVIDVFGRVAGLQGGRTIRRILLGWLGARDVREARRNARARYRRHYAELRAAVPPERRLDFDLADGWAPLCEFLGRPVPDVPFPRVNERAEHVARVRAKQALFLHAMGRRVLRIVLPWLFGSAIVGGAVWVARHPKAAVKGWECVKSVVGLHYNTSLFHNWRLI